MNRMFATPIACRRLNDAPHHHFFGYYNKTVWHRDGRYLLANRTAFADAVLTPELRAEVGYFDLKDGDRYHAVGETTAWNWQMGCQLQWLDGAPSPQLIYNCRSADDSGVYPGFRSAIHDIATGQTRVLPLPIYGTIWILVIALFIFVARRTWRRNQHWAAAQGAEGVLRERYARGEVDETEYRQRMEVLRSGEHRQK